jgi:uridine kinase
MDSRRVQTRIAELRAVRELVLVGIGGHGAAGKTTLARSIPDAVVVGTDEFWNGREFELSRLRREVLDRLVAGEPAEFASFDWVAQERRGRRTVLPTGVVVVEGVCALHRMFRDDYQLRIWVDAPRDVRLARGIARDGESARATWEEIWMPLEDRYVAADDPVAAADLIVDGTA